MLLIPRRQSRAEDLPGFLGREPPQILPCPPLWMARCPHPRPAAPRFHSTALIPSSRVGSVLALVLFIKLAPYPTKHFFRYPQKVDTPHAILVRFGALRPFRSELWVRRHDKYSRRCEISGKIFRFVSLAVGRRSRRIIVNFMFSSSTARTLTGFPPPRYPQKCRWQLHPTCPPVRPRVWHPTTATRKQMSLVSLGDHFPDNGLGRIVLLAQS